MRKWKAILYPLVLFLVCWLPSVASANAIWPALHLEERILVWWVILSGFIFEFIVILVFLKCTVGKALLYCSTVNLASTILGVLLIPLSGFLWEFFPGYVLYSWFGLGTFNPITWGATFLLAVMINVTIEGFVLSKFFGVTWGRCVCLMLVLANAVSVGFAVISLVLSPVSY
jgi:hypothetical protein